MSTTRSFSTGRPRMGSTVIVSPLRSCTSVLQASRLTPLIIMAQEPQMAWPQLRRKASVPSVSHFTLCSRSRTRSIGSASSW